MLPADKLQQLLNSIDELLAPIPGDNPAGVPLAPDDRNKLKSYREEVPADEYDPDSKAIPPDWAKAVEYGREVLKTRSKDLRVGCFLLESYTVYRGWGGLLAGLKLLTGLVENWDIVHPKRNAEDDDPELYSNIFDWFLKDKFGIWFPNTVRNLALFGGNQFDERGEKGVNALDFKKLLQFRAQDKEKQSGPSLVKMEELEKTIANVPVDVSVRRLDLIKKCQAELERFGKTLEEKLAEEDRLVLARLLNKPVSEVDDFDKREHGQQLSLRPTLGDLQACLSECAGFVQARLPKAAVAAAEKEAENSEEASDSQAVSDQPYIVGGSSLKSSDSPAALITTRSQAYAKLEEVAQLLEQLEPHSPVPYLVRRAVMFGNLPFPALMRELVRDDSILGNMNRELGIKESAETSSGYAAEG